MKRFRQLSAAFLLMLVLSFSAFAGEMATTRTATLPSQPQAASTGEMDTGKAGEMQIPAKEHMLTLLLGILSLI